MSFKIDTHTIIPITYSNTSIDMSFISDNQNDPFDNILKIVENHLVSTVKNIFSAMYFYTSQHRRTNSDYMDNMNDTDDNFMIADMV
jgi:hypothetical protein